MGKRLGRSFFPKTAATTSDLYLIYGQVFSVGKLCGNEPQHLWVKPPQIPDEIFVVSVSNCVGILTLFFSYVRALGMEGSDTV